MKIAFDARGMTSFTGGVGVYSERLRRGLHSQGYEIYAFDEQDILTSQSLPHTGITRKYLNVSLAFRGRPKLDQLVSDSEVLFMPNINITSLSETKPVVLTIHDLSFYLWPECLTPKIRLWHTLIRPQRLMQQASQIITVSHSTKQDLQDIYNIPEKNIQVIYPGVDQRFFQTVSHRQSSELQQKFNLPPDYILFLGVIEPRKNIIQIIHAFEGLAQYFPDLHLVIAGKKGWKWRQIMKAIDTSSAKERIRYLGFIDESDKLALYQNARIFVFPSLYEGFGFPPLEAMAAGIPTITSQVSSFPEVVENGAWKVSPYDIQELQWAMQQLLTYPQVSREYAQAGKRQAKKYSWRTTIEETQNVLQSVKSKTSPW